MRNTLCAGLSVGVLFISACEAEKLPCDDQLVILQGNGPTAVESQWDACVARNASKIVQNQIADKRLAEIAVELCQTHANRYSVALHDSNDLLTSKYVGQLVEYKRENLFKIAVSELSRARRLGCEAK